MLNKLSLVKIREAPNLSSFTQSPTRITSWLSLLSQPHFSEYWSYSRSKSNRCMAAIVTITAIRRDTAVTIRISSWGRQADGVLRLKKSGSAVLLLYGCRERSSLRRDISLESQLKRMRDLNWCWGYCSHIRSMRTISTLEGAYSSEAVNRLSLE